MSEFDVAFSFAGEDREYVEKTFRHLRAKGVSVFYDRDQAVNLWAKDLYQYLSDIYSKQAKYCVVFLSRHYAAKLWTKHELKGAQARAFQENREYLLPARFDDTEIPGLLPQIAYIDLRSIDPQQFADLICQKVGSGEPAKERLAQRIDPELEKRLADAVLLAEEYLGPIGLGMAESIAALVRKSFQEMGTTPSLDDALPYLRNPKAPYRVVGYLACQVATQSDQDISGWALDLSACLVRERKEAVDNRETRPLWQLLVCITYALQSLLSPSDRDHLRDALRDMQAFLQSNAHLDAEGQCKWRIGELLG